MTHILHTNTVHKTASLAYEAILHISSLAAHTILNIDKPMEISINRSPQPYAQMRDRTRNFLLTRTTP